MMRFFYTEHFQRSLSRDDDYDDDKIILFYNSANELEWFLFKLFIYFYLEHFQEV